MKVGVSVLNKILDRSRRLKRKYFNVGLKHPSVQFFVNKGNRAYDNSLPLIRKYINRTDKLPAASEIVRHLDRDLESVDRSIESFFNPNGTINDDLIRKAAQDIHDAAQQYSIHGSGSDNPITIEVLFGLEQFFLALDNVIKVGSDLQKQYPDRASEIDDRLESTLIKFDQCFQSLLVQFDKETKDLIQELFKYVFPDCKSYNTDSLYPNGVELSIMGKHTRNVQELNFSEFCKGLHSAALQLEEHTGSVANLAAYVRQYGEDIFPAGASDQSANLIPNLLKIIENDLNEYTTNATPWRDRIKDLTTFMQTYSQASAGAGVINKGAEKVLDSFETLFQTVASLDKVYDFLNRDRGPFYTQRLALRPHLAEIRSKLTGFLNSLLENFDLETRMSIRTRSYGVWDQLIKEKRLKLDSPFKVMQDKPSGLKTLVSAPSKERKLTYEDIKFAFEEISSRLKPLTDILAPNGSSSDSMLQEKLENLGEWFNSCCAVIGDKINPVLKAAHTIFDDHGDVVKLKRDGEAQSFDKEFRDLNHLRTMLGKINDLGGDKSPMINTAPINNLISGLVDIFKRFRTSIHQKA